MNFQTILKELFLGLLHRLLQTNYIDLIEIIMEALKDKSADDLVDAVEKVSEKDDSVRAVVRTRLGK